MGIPTVSSACDRARSKNQSTSREPKHLPTRGDSDRTRDYRVGDIPAARGKFPYADDGCTRPRSRYRLRSVRKGCGVPAFSWRPSSSIGTVQICPPPALSVYASRFSRAASNQQTHRYLNVTDEELRRGLEVSLRRFPLGPSSIRFDTIGSNVEPSSTRRSEAAISCRAQASMSLDTLQLETARLVLRVPRASDLDPWAEMMADEENARFIGGSRRARRRGACS